MTAGDLATCCLVGGSRPPVQCAFPCFCFVRLDSPGEVCCFVCVAPWAVARLLFHARILPCPSAPTQPDGKDLCFHRPVSHSSLSRHLSRVLGGRRRQRRSNARSS